MNPLVEEIVQGWSKKITENKDLSVGSYRIWVNDLNNYFNKINIESKISPLISISEIWVC